MNRHVIKNAAAGLSSREIVEKRITDINQQINESKSKIEEYIEGVHSKIQLTISNKLNRYATMHEQIIQSKDEQIRIMAETMQRFKEKQLSERENKLKETLVEYRESMQRMSSILEMFKRQSQKYKIELDITEKQLAACKEREKKLLKKLWTLEENVKDIYSHQFLEVAPEQNCSIVTKFQQKLTHRSRKNDSNLLKSHQSTSKAIINDRISTQQRSKLKTLPDDLPLTPKPTIYDKTKLSEQLNLVNQTKSKSVKPLAVSYESINLQQQQAIQQKQANFKPNLSIYDDLRHSLRKINRIETECPKYIQEGDRTIGLEQFKLISVNGPKIMKQIEKIVIQKHGSLKQLDEQAIELLNELFMSQNAVKILEIILFSYSIEALRLIKKQKNQIVLDNYYSQPGLQESQGQLEIKLQRPRKYKIDMQIRKNFRNSLTSKKVNKKYKQENYQS